MSAIDPQVAVICTQLRTCGSFYTMIHLASVIPPNLSTDALKIFGEEVSSTIETLIMPEVWWPGFALCLAASAFISSWASSGFGCAEDNHLKQAIRIYNSQVIASNATVASILESPITQTALSAKDCRASFPILSGLVLPSQQGSSLVCIMSGVGWTCVPQAVDTFGNCGKEFQDVHLTSPLPYPFQKRQLWLISVAS